MDTKADWYAQRLKSKETIWWKRLLDRQAPYRWKLQNLNLGLVLDVGCGLGRNLANLNGHGVGVDHNESCVAEARRRGFIALSTSEFPQSTASTRSYSPTSSSTCRQIKACKSWPNTCPTSAPGAKSS